MKENEINGIERKKERNELNETDGKKKKEKATAMR